MPRSTPTPITPDPRLGALAAPTAPDALGDIIPTGSVLLVVECGATGTTVDIPTPATTAEGFAIADGGGPVASNTTRVFGPVPSRLFAQPPDALEGPGQTLVNYSSVATVTRYLITC
jgi:hypothetical protein